MSTWTLDRARCAIEKLSGARLDWSSFSEELMGQLQRSLGIDGWCLAQTDPDTLLAVRAAGRDSPAAGDQQEFWRIEYQERDAAKFAPLAQSRPRAIALSAATGGDLRRSRRWAQVLGPAGAGDEIRAALLAGGECWGSLSLYRASAAQPFTGDDIRHLTQVLPAAAAGARGTWTFDAPAGGIPGSGGADGPGTVIVTAAGVPVTATPEAGRWLARLGSGTRVSYPLFSALTALLTAPGPGADPAARVRTRAADGCWLDIHAAPLAAGLPGGHVAITIQAAAPERIGPLLMRAYGLSPRERQIASLILGGCTHAQIARALHISAHTIHDHGKTILKKTATHSQPQLIRCLTGQLA